MAKQAVFVGVIPVVGLLERELGKEVAERLLPMLRKLPCRCPACLQEEEAEPLEDEDDLWE